MDARAIRHVLKGDRAALMEAFLWSDTPQGGMYWAKRFDGQEDISKEDKDYLRSLLPKRKPLPEKPPKAPVVSTQVAQILNHMRSKGYITQRDASIDYGVQSFTRRIADIRDLGFEVVKEATRHPTSNQLYYRYSLKA